MLLFLPSHRQPRSGLPLRGSPPGRESGAHAALSCSPARRRRKLIGFLRRERRFDVVSHNVLAPYFTTYLKLSNWYEEDSVTRLSVLWT